MEYFGIFAILEQRFHSNCRQQIKLKLQKAEENLTLLQKDLLLVFLVENADCKIESRPKCEKCAQVCFSEVHCSSK